MKEQIKKALSQELPFVIYRKPNEKVRFGWFQNDKTLYKTKTLSKSCFVFAPFSGDEKVVFYPENCELLKDESELKVSFSESEPVLNNPSANKNFHVALVQKGINSIKEGLMQKVVLSRKEEVVIDAASYEIYFHRLLEKYPTAFVYWFYHPEIGMWMGATPEQLVKINDVFVETVALAGTMVADNTPLNEVVWGLKEIDEQNVVTKFITNHLKDLSKVIDQSKPYTYKAGSLLHIKTDIKAELQDKSNAYKVVDALHPTPALCGFPKEAAREFILNNEGYDREFYGGYLGEWQFNNLDYANKSDLFVNLRCMKINGTHASLFLGGGVNKDSNAEDEFYETVNKSKTVKSIL